ncbi:transcriptional regulator [Xenorhabdus indica]|nr:transcriptional regulator [Xenorhabdus indica]
MNSNEDYVSIPYTKGANDGETIPHEVISTNHWAHDQLRGLPLMKMFNPPHPSEVIADALEELSLGIHVLPGH